MHTSNPSYFQVLPASFQSHFIDMVANTIIREALYFTSIDNDNPNDIPCIENFEQSKLKNKPHNTIDRSTTMIKKTQPTWNNRSFLLLLLLLQMTTEIS